MLDGGCAQAGGPFRYYAFWFDERPACFWPEAALRLPAGERAEDFVGHLGRAARDHARAVLRIPFGRAQHAPAETYNAGVTI
jgi:hypothetical protein